MRRKLFNFAAAASLMICVALLAVRFFRPQLEFYHQATGGGGFGIAYGDVGFHGQWRTAASGVTYRPGFTVSLGVGAFFASLLPWVWLLERDWRSAHPRLNKGICHICGYNLTGNTGGVCPECGTAVVGKFETKA